MQQWQDSLDRQLRQPKKNEAIIHHILIEASKEIGNMFTNRRAVSGHPGESITEPIEMARVVYFELVRKGHPPEEVISFIQERYSVSLDDLDIDAM